MSLRPIRTLAWLLALGAVAVCIALAAKYSEGYVVVIAAGYRTELSFNLAVLLVVLAAIVFHLAARGVGLALGAPAWFKARQEREAQAQANTELGEALRGLFSGRFDSAERAAKRALQHPATRDLGATVAAWAAFESGRPAAALPYLEQVDGAPSATMRDATRAYVLLADGKAAEALPILKQLHEADPRNPGVLKMKLEAELAEKRWEQVLATLPLVVKTGLMPEAASQPIRQDAELQYLKQKAANRDSLVAAWQAMPAASRYDPIIAHAVASQLMRLGCGVEAQAAIEDTLNHDGAQSWDSALARLYGDCKGDSTLTQIERAERWLRTQARDAGLLMALGKLCMRQGLWGKAQSYLEASVALSPSMEAHMTLASLMERVGKPAEATRHIRRSAELAG